MSIKYRGYGIVESSGKGKAGKFSKTASMKVMENIGNGFVVKGYYSFPKGDSKKRQTAIDKAKAKIDRILAEDTMEM